MRLLRAAIVTIALASLAGATAEPTAGAPAYDMVGRQAPHFAAPLAGGGMLADDDLLGKWTIIEFWALWCHDSMADLRYSEALARAAAQDPHLRFVAIHVDQRYGRWDSVEDFLRGEGIAYPVALDPRRDVMGLFHVTSTPTYLVLDPYDTIRAVHYDLRKDGDPEGGVKAIIKQIHALRLDDNAKRLRRF